MAAIKLTKKLLLLFFMCLIIISGVLGILRDVFLKEYEEQYHFWISVLMGVFTGGLTVILIRFFSNSLGKSRER
jgi:uncharacterized membrane protein HdeD (DUF308 family)